MRVAQGRIKMTEYTKQSLTFAEQMSQLQQRGLTISDPDLASRYLQRVGYYRLMGYLFPQRIPGSDRYVAGATIEEALLLYDFDRCLRELVLEAVGHIEVALRTSITYHFSHAHGPFGHRDAEKFSYNTQWHAEWLQGLTKEVQRSKEVFLTHYRQKYTNPPFPDVPIWMATEIMSMGTLSLLFQAMLTPDKKVIAADFGLPSAIFGSWMHATSVIRNIAAHHGRLWNRALRVTPARPQEEAWSVGETPFPPNRCFFMLLVLRQLLRHTAADDIAWRDRVSTLLQTARPRHLRSMGAIDQWQNHSLWT